MEQIKALQEAGFALAEIEAIMATIGAQKTKNKKLTLFLRQVIQDQRDRLFKKERLLAAVRKSLDRTLAQTAGCPNCAAQGSDKDCKGCGNLEKLQALGFAG
jgi:DNA-binding transcriptional MerR regulator